MRSFFDLTDSPDLTVVHDSGGDITFKVYQYQTKNAYPRQLAEWLGICNYRFISSIKCLLK